MPAVASIELPRWAQVTPRRAAHIARVTALLDRWADTMGVDDPQATAMRDAGRWHDALRDAPEEELRRLLDDWTTDASLLHGPAAARRLRADGERRDDVLDAITHHTVGSATWGLTGKTLYMADYLEPGRIFAREERAVLAERVPRDVEGVFRDVVRHRMAWARDHGFRLDPRSIELWNAVQ